MGYPAMGGGGGASSIGSGGQYATKNGNRTTAKPVLEKTKAVSYNETTSDQIFAVSTDVSATASEAIPSRVEIENTGRVPIMLMVGYSSYTDDTTIDATDYLHTLLPAGQTFSPPVRSVISSAADKTIMFGTAVSNTAPNSNLYVDSGENCAGLANTTDPVTLTTSGGMFRVADLIRVENEIMEVTAIDGGSVTVYRAMFGSAAASHSDATDIRFPFFNAYHDFDKFSVAQTDSLGRWKSKNFFGKSRTDSGLSGITAGSVAIQFYESGYQSLGLNGINANTETGLTAGTSFEFDITVDGGTTFDNLSFTTDSSDTTFGNVITKIATALDTQYYTAGNLFEKKVHVSLSGGDLVFQSGTSLSTSAISLANADGGTNFWGVGRIPAIANINAAVAARLASESVYDPVTNSSVY